MPGFLPKILKKSAIISTDLSFIPTFWPGGCFLFFPSKVHLFHFRNDFNAINHETRNGNFYKKFLR